MINTLSQRLENRILVEKMVGSPTLVELLQECVVLDAEFALYKRKIARILKEFDELDIDTNDYFACRMRGILEDINYDGECY